MKWQYNVAYLLLFNTTLVYAETIIKPLSIEVIDNKEAPFSDASLDLESFNAIKNIKLDQPEPNSKIVVLLLSLIN